MIQDLSFLQEGGGMKAIEEFTEELMVELELEEEVKKLFDLKLFLVSNIEEDSTSSAFSTDLNSSLSSS